MYRISRKLRNVAETFGASHIETEQLYMRYNFQPYFTSFDMASFCLSLFTTDFYRLQQKSIDKSIILKYIRDPKYLESVYSQIVQDELKGNFGSLISLIMSRTEIPDDLFIHNFNTLDYLQVPQLYITKNLKIGRAHV